MRFFANDFGKGRIIDTALAGRQRPLAVGAVFLEQLNLAFASIVDAFVVAFNADRPVHGIALDAQHFFDFFH